MQQKLILPIATLMVGSLAGFFVGKGNAPQKETSTNNGDALVSSSNRRSSESNSNGNKKKMGNAKGVNTQEILQKPGQLARMQTLLDFYASLNPDQLANEANKLDAISMPERIMASYLLFAKWAETDPYSALDHSGKMGFAGMFVKPTIMQSWASVDPSSAAKYFDSNKGEFSSMSLFGGGGGPMGNGGGSIIASEWARQNPDEAMQWAKTLKGNESSNAIRSIVEQVATTDPQKAMALAAALTGDEKKRANRDIAASLGAKDWGAAEKFIATLPAEEQANARSRAFDSLAKENPRDAMNQISSFTTDEERNSATASVAESMSKVEPKEAFDLVMKSSVQDEDVMRNVMMNYARQDNAGALESIKTIPQGEMRDTAIGTYVFSNTGTDYAQSLTLAESITDEGSRDRAVGVSVGRWMTTDPDGAKAAVKNSTAISDDMKKRIEEGRFWGAGRNGRGGFGSGRGQ